ncbi:hypothetical protein BU26DRAFT_449534 [Trematosphaeria pertusa]|uniref:SMP domain-containing protein n=1 Tax=Trematosphaeria pertusa TaxID=390896 RepID=A0A6A6IT91_9PLEO|nr:uncharacterized protein BU26DRAFT_449534 [Trematosphaeria pertusa]KAF2253062.1 hypothetical protein BU26DRAFT_449534 [Trematosphaeria pertusa]
MSSADNAKDAQFHLHLQKVLDKLQTEPLSITTEDARRLSENYEARDERSAKIISAVESLAVAAQDVHEQVPQLGQGPQTSILTVVNDLKAAVDTNPKDVTPEVLKTTQGIVSMMQRAVGQTNAPHPELEAELQREFAKIEPKVEQGTVTKEEADYLHSLEARAHGHTEKGGLTAHAQSVAAKRSRALSLSDNTNSQSSVNATVKATSPVGKGLAPEEQSHRDKETNLKMAELTIGSKIENEPEHITKDEAAYVQSREHRAHGHVKKGSVAAEALHFADKNPTVEAN